MATGSDLEYVAETNEHQYLFLQTSTSQVERLGGARPKIRGVQRQGGPRHRGDRVNKPSEDSERSDFKSCRKNDRQEGLIQSRGRGRIQNRGWGVIQNRGQRATDREKPNSARTENRTYDETKRNDCGHLPTQRRGAPRGRRVYNDTRTKSSGTESRTTDTAQSTNIRNQVKGPATRNKQHLERLGQQQKTSDGTTSASISADASYDDFRRQRTRDNHRASVQSPNKVQAKLKQTSPPISEEELQTFLKEKPSDILSKLVSRKDECLALLNQDKFNDNAFMLTLRVLSRMCDVEPVSASISQDLNITLSMVETSSFLSKHLSRYLVGLSTKQPQNPDESKTDDVQTLASDVSMMLKLLQVFLQHKPSGYSEVGVVLILLEKVVTSAALNNADVDGDLFIQIQRLKESYNHLEESQQSAKQRSMVKPPPDNFRDIPIFPESSEIRKPTKPFLRKNIIKGRYDNVEHYLDVQFRLLREDFVAPLREGVTEFLSDTKNRLQDIRIYRNVFIVKKKFGNNGFVFTLQFDVSGLKRVRWESSKRLIYGSFVCLTKDKFQHMLCATIENRRLKDLENGTVEIRFLTEISDNALKGQFIMAESSAYFEACRHVLQGLQQMTTYNFPFKKFIVDVSSNVDHPVYIRDDNYITYNLEALQSGQLSIDVDVGRLHRLGHTMYTDGKLVKVAHVPILQPEKWPTADDLHLDESQKAALQAALTKEFAIIQGPPGTGKTYIGLKIIEILLHNKPWKYATPETDEELSTSDEEDEEVSHTSPILVVCYTNHALDQFLEGILDSGEENVIRVGSRSDSERLESKNLSRLRRNRPRRRRQQTGNVGEVRQQLRETEENIENALHKVNLAKRVILNVDTLNKYMSRENGRDLIMPWVPRELRYDPTTNLLWWLNVVDSTDTNKSQPYSHHYQGQRGRETENCIEIEDEGYRIQRERQTDDSYGSRGTREQTRKDEIFQNIAAYDSKCVKRCGRDQMSTPKTELQKLDIMTDEEAAQIKSMWPLKIWDRWRLYRLWVKSYIEGQEKLLTVYCQSYDELSLEMQDINAQDDVWILREANVIGMTTTGAAKCRSVLQLLGPRIVVVEEAAEVLEAHIITTLTAKCQHLILIGDHQQLKPNPTVYRLAKVFNMDTSLFERMINNGVPCQSLTHQHRMRPEISKLMKKHFYKNLHDDESVMGMEDVKGVVHNMFFIDHHQLEDEVDDNKTKSNQYEAEVLVELCRYLLYQGYKPSQITVLTTYLGQLFSFKKLMDKATFEGVRVCVVDNFQGEENDIILLSLVRSNEEGSIGFLKTSNRVCVALSRARMGFYCIGNASVLKKATIWQDIIGTLEVDNRIGSSLPLVCQNHSVVTNVASAKDFRDKVPCGGCCGPCEYRLPCGHVCTSLCHPYDPDHKIYKCEKPCLKCCEREEHPCSQRCYEDCRPCETIVPKLMPNCDHAIQVYCHKFDSISCTVPCPKALTCGHSCKELCSQQCTLLCVVKVMKTFPKCGHDVLVECHRNLIEVLCQRQVKKNRPRCGHEILMECYEDPDDVDCPQNCEKVLKCGHKCPKKCSELCPREKLSDDSRVHEIIVTRELSSAFCSEKCENVLPCGHPCPNKCGEPCATKEVDRLIIDRLNRHGPSINRYRPRNRFRMPQISTKCSKSVKRELPNCGHIETMLCYQDVESIECSNTCREVLACGHRCTNKCGVPCCKCTQTVQKKLPTCGHVVKLPCTQNVNSYKCVMKCERKLKCGHQCPNQCGEPCPKTGAVPVSSERNRRNISTRCEEIVEKTLPSCGHFVTTSCYKNVASIRCTEFCDKVLACKHRCINKCGAPCKCKQKVWKKLTTCTHNIKLPCNQDVTPNIRCRKCPKKK